MKVLVNWPSFAVVLMCLAAWVVQADSPVPAHPESCSATVRQLDRWLSAARASGQFQPLGDHIVIAARERTEGCAPEVVEWLMHREELIPDREVAAMFRSVVGAIQGSPHEAYAARVAMERPERMAASEDRSAYLHRVASLSAVDLATMFKSKSEFARFTAAAMAACEPRRSRACSDAASVESALAGLTSSPDVSLDADAWARLWRATRWVKE